MKLGSHRNSVLLKEWREFGPEMFEFSEIEILEPSSYPSQDPARDLHILEELWIEKLSPFGDRGYNKPPKTDL